MYQIKCDNYILYDFRDPDLIVFNPRLKLEENTVGEGSFEIYDTHPHYDKLKMLKSIFEVSDEYGVLFRGRMTGNTLDINNGKAVDLEGAMAFFNDTIVRPFNFPGDFKADPDYIAAANNGNVIEFFLNWLIENHNSRVQDFQKFKLGTVTVTDPNNYLSRSSSEYKTTWETLKDKLFGSALGGSLCVRYEADGNYIDYLSEYTETNPQHIVFGENLLDFKSESDAGETYSAMIPRGATTETQDSAGNTVKNTVTIAGLPDGNVTDDIVKEGDLIYSRSAVDQYGWICARPEDTTWEDVTKPQNLLTKAVAALAADGVMLSNTTEYNAVDLHFTDSEIRSFRIYRKIIVEHDSETAFDLTKLEPDLLNPQNTKITVGKTRRTLTDANSKDKANTLIRIEKVEQDMKQNETNLSEVYELAEDAKETANNAQEAADDAMEAVNDLDKSLNQEEVFNRLTNGGEDQGVYIENGKVYINAEYLKSGSFTATGEVLLKPCMEEAKKIMGYLVGTEEIPDEEIPLYDFSGDGVIAIDDAMLVMQSAYGMWSFEDWSGAKKTKVTVTIDPNNLNKPILFTGTNMWGRKIEHWIGLEDAFIKSDELGRMYRVYGSEKEWLFPPMEPDVEYRTAERSGFSAIYKKRDSSTGRVFWRREDETEWHEYKTVETGEPVTDSDSVSVKDVPESASSVAKVNKIGGKTRKCTNLIPFPYGFGNSVQAGVTVTVNSDGGVTYNGTATAQINPYFVSNLLLPKGTYTLSGAPKGASWTTQLLIVQTNDYSTILAQDYGNGKTFTLDADTVVRICLIVANGATCSNLTVYPMLNEGTEALPYEPYFEGLRSAPVTEVESVGANLFGGETLADKLVSVSGATKDEKNKTVTYAASNIRGKILFENFKPNTRYTFIFKGYNSSATLQAVNVNIQYTDGTAGSTTLFGLAGVENCWYCVSAEGKSIQSFYGTWDTQSTTLYYEECGIFEGVLTVEDFEPYTRNTLPIPEAVQALDGYGDGVNESVYNYIDLDAKQFVKRVGKVDLGTQSWTKYSDYDHCFYTSAMVSRKAGVEPLLMAEYENTFSFTADKGVFGNGTYGSMLYIVDNRYTTANEIKSALSGVMLYYELATPEITDISDLLPSDNILSVEAGGTVTMRNEYGYDVPNTVTFYLGANKMICAPEFVGNLTGKANRAVADEYGNNIAETYAKKGEGGSVSQEEVDTAKVITDEITSHGQQIVVDVDALLGGDALATVDFSNAEMRASQFSGNLNGTATKASKVIDSGNGREITLKYSGDGLTDPRWIAAWNGYELGGVDRTSLKVGYATKATQDGNGNDISSTYLRLSGGTISRNDTDTPLHLNAIKSDADGCYIGFDANGASLGYLGVDKDKKPVFYDSSAKTIIHSGNIGSQSVASATKATQDGNGNNIAATYATKGEVISGTVVDITSSVSVSGSNGDNPITKAVDTGSSVLILFDGEQEFGDLNVTFPSYLQSKRCVSAFMYGASGAKDIAAYDNLFGTELGSFWSSFAEYGASLEIKYV